MNKIRKKIKNRNFLVRRVVIVHRNTEGLAYEGGIIVKKMTLRQGQVDSITLQKDYLLLKTKETIYHLPLTTEIIHSSTGQSLALTEVKKGLYFQNYYYQGQHVLAINESDAFYGVITGIYDAKKSLIADELMMRHHESTKCYGAQLIDGAQVIAFCQILTRSIPPQGTPLAIFVFKN